MADNHIDPAAGAQVRADDRAHVFHSWSAQAHIDPVPIAGAQGSWFWDYDGNRYFDLGSQMVNVNAGHGHPAIVEAICEQARILPTISPAFGNDVRGELARLIAERAPGDLDKVFFTNAGAEANEHAVRMARVVTGRSTVLSMYRSYHGASGTTIGLTGDPRRWRAEPTGGDVVRFFGPYPYRSPWATDSVEAEAAAALAHLRMVVELQGPNSIAAIIIETVIGTNGVLVPPPGYLAGVRELCDEYGIIYIADEVMVGFGRLGEWFGVNAFGVTPDLITFAKGVNSGYVPLGGVVIGSRVAQHFDDVPYPGGLTYSGHPLACAAGVASIKAFEADGVIDRVRATGEDLIRPTLSKIAANHPSVGEIRGMGFFWAIELVRNPETREGLVPFNASGPDAAPMAELIAACKAKGVWPFTHFNRIHVAPPLTTSDDELTDALAVIDEVLDLADAHVVS
ncbi:aspartate aminotransferase family protein [Williamsia maris]|uniref:Taurine---2-oxoglutarate transaminase n=1 Tax=Williamsia maris TaxID=72806 RepID=A0ABT1H8H2_9NOCA|nr:aspartate aminotransferase family protein [Williamsia maris]MCP2174552.1 taurine---2-oxoglutarate transaminase [Williamsia maris]